MNTPKAPVRRLRAVALPPPQPPARDRTYAEIGDELAAVSVELASASPPSTAIHRLYWRRLGHPDEDKVSAFLSYPQGMGCVDEYFWEISSYGPERFLGADAETQMETRIRELLLKRPARRR